MGKADQEELELERDSAEICRRATAGPKPASATRCPIDHSSMSPRETLLSEQSGGGILVPSAADATSGTATDFASAAQGVDIENPGSGTRSSKAGPAEARVSRAELLGPGWPRPYIKISKRLQEERNLPDKLPVVWSEAEGNVDSGHFAQGPDGGPGIALLESNFQLCDICGDPVGKNVVYGGSAPANNSVGPSGMHPRCCLLALKFCPYFRGQEEPELLLSRTGPAVDIKGFEKKFAREGEASDIPAALKILNTPVNEWDNKIGMLNERIFTGAFIEIPLVASRVEPVSVAALRKLARNEPARPGPAESGRA